MAAARPGGAREHRLRDWPYGAVGRRLMLEALLLDDQPDDGWTKRALEERAETQPGGLDRILAGALQWGLVEQREGRWRRADEQPAIASPLEELLRITQQVRDEPIFDLPKRPYRRRN